MNLVNFRPVGDNDIPLIEQWMYKEYILKWYHEPEEWLKEIKERNGKFSFLNHFIVLDGNTPFAFCQFYDCFDAQEEWYSINYPGTIYSIDYLIGEEVYLSKGYGKAIVKSLIDMIMNFAGAEKIIVQPENENIPSVKSLLSNGFKYDAEGQYYYLDKKRKAEQD